MGTKQSTDQMTIVPEMYQKKESMIHSSLPTMPNVLCELISSYVSYKFVSIHLSDENYYKYPSVFGPDDTLYFFKDLNLYAANGKNIINTKIQLDFNLSMIICSKMFDDRSYHIAIIGIYDLVIYSSVDFELVKKFHFDHLFRAMAYNNDNDLYVLHRDGIKKLNNKTYEEIENYRGDFGGFPGRQIIKTTQNGCITIRHNTHDNIEFRHFDDNLQERNSKVEVSDGLKYWCLINMIDICLNGLIYLYLDVGKFKILDWLSWKEISELPVELPKEHEFTSLKFHGNDFCIKTIWKNKHFLLRYKTDMLVRPR
ncbi:MAG: hypothetical protein Harvfovirus22_6 [Harvfovirus sp.]|uniref:Uncharacterized protein n=1 Tax=Harvfovirus sp. TaxID=2487768 RepID=A0A3G5A4T4_9VIRU|nr:MAG: hypothetical protein Harvfovirus22_6 [Harvfovirus sp.]